MDIRLTSELCLSINWFLLTKPTIKRANFMSLIENNIFFLFYRRYLNLTLPNTLEGCLNLDARAKEGTSLTASQNTSMPESLLKEDTMQRLCKKRFPFQIIPLVLPSLFSLFLKAPKISKLPKFLLTTWFFIHELFILYLYDKCKGTPYNILCSQFFPKYLYH